MSAPRGIVLFCFVSLLSLGEVARASVGQQVLWVTGDVSARQLDERNAQPLLLQATDPLQGKVRINAPAESALWLLSGNDLLLGLHGPGTWTLEGAHAPKGEGRITRIALGGASLEPNQHVPWVERGRDTQANAPLVPVSPVETALMTRRPVLRWRNQARVLRVSLTLSVMDQEGKRRLVETWTGLTGSHHEVSRPLTPGLDYAWRLEVDESADTGKGEAITTWFHVLSDDLIAAARGADASISRLQLDYPEAVKALEVIRALTWERHGLAREAQKAWDELAHQAGDIEALRLYRARLGLRVLARPRQALSKQSGAKLR